MARPKKKIDFEALKRRGKLCRHPDHRKRVAFPSGFDRNAQTADGYHDWCKVCRKKVKKRWLSTHRGYTSEMSTHWLENRLSQQPYAHYPVIQMVDGNETRWPTVVAAAQHMRPQAPHNAIAAITAACRGKQKKAYKSEWRYDRTCSK